MTNAILLVVALAVVGWCVYRWLRRNIGRQKYATRRKAGRAAFFIVLSIVVAVRGCGHSQLMAGWIAGLVPGILLGIWGLRLSRFENAAEGRFYTPSNGIGAGLFVIFFLRLAYRVFAIKAQIAFSGLPAPAVGQSALTNFTFELLAGYHIAYSIGLVWHFRPRGAAIAAGPAA